jgi:hypothetical protein
MLAILFVSEIIPLQRRPFFNQIFILQRVKTNSQTHITYCHKYFLIFKTILNKAMPRMKTFVTQNDWTL